MPFGEQDLRPEKNGIASWRTESIGRVELGRRRPVSTVFEESVSLDDPIGDPSLLEVGRAIRPGRGRPELALRDGPS